MTTIELLQAEKHIGKLKAAGFEAQAEFMKSLVDLVRTPVDMVTLTDDLTDIFIRYQHRLDNPMPTPFEGQQALHQKYIRDPEFNAKVKSLVSGVMFTVSNSLKRG